MVKLLEEEYAVEDALNKLGWTTDYYKMYGNGDATEILMTFKKDGEALHVHLRK